MPVATLITELDTTAANNSPPGTESARGNIDDYLRSHAAFIRQTYNGVQSGSFAWAGTAGGTANALTLTLTPAITAYSAGQRFLFKSGAAANTAAVTASVSGLTPLAVQSNGVACSAGKIAANQWYEILVDASLTSCQLNKIGVDGAIDRKTTTVDVVNTLTATEIYRFTVPANTLGTTKKLRLTILGDLLYNNSTLNQPEIDIAFGATFFSLMLFTLSGLSASRRPVKIVVELAAKGTTNSQVGQTVFIIGEANGVAGLGFVIDKHVMAAHHSIAEDSTAAKDLYCQVQWVSGGVSAASVNNSFRMLDATLEIL